MRSYRAGTRKVIRFHLDEHVHPGIAIGLRSRGIDVTTTVDAGLLEAKDLDHIDFALAKPRRVIVTHDDDFLKHHSEGISHAGIAYCHQHKYSVGELLQMLSLLHACYSEEEMQGRVEFL